ncbi:oxygenase MpaB family protein [Nocardioides convexus]|uniref:oxygenase MpaB family protein n=1 Tax=Nocardioides convexus TaxID=2712224 RepID=UPI002418B4F2|nr:oxygenase MpaB family protein [Nocardioides convexus]
MAIRKRSLTPAEDYGFFGPGSVAWKVWGYPTSLTVGFSRAVVVEELDPHLVASVDRTQDIYRRPKTRYDRTIRYFALVAFGDSRTTSRAADVLVKVHSKAIGTEPYSGERYDANDPDSRAVDPRHRLALGAQGLRDVRPRQALARRGGPVLGRVRPSRGACRPATPTTCRATAPSLHAYYERMRPQMSGSPIARKAMAHLMDVTQARTGAAGAAARTLGGRPVLPCRRDRHPPALDARDG